MTADAIRADGLYHVYGTRVALDARDGDQDIWIWDLARETLLRLTTDPGPNRSPVWSPDSRSVLFRKSQGAPCDMAVPKEGVVAMPAGAAVCAAVLIVRRPVHAGWAIAASSALTAAGLLVVLGAAQYDGRPSAALQGRLDHARELYEQGYAERIVFTGGGGNLFDALLQTGSCEDGNGLLGAGRRQGQACCSHGDQGGDRDHCRLQNPDHGELHFDISLGIYR